MKGVRHKIRTASIDTIWVNINRQITRTVSDDVRGHVDNQSTYHVRFQTWNRFWHKLKFLKELW